MLHYTTPPQSILFRTTLYSRGPDFTEEAVCVYPSTDHDIGSDGTVLDFGIYASVS